HEIVNPILLPLIGDDARVDRLVTRGRKRRRHSIDDDVLWRRDLQADLVVGQLLEGDQDRFIEAALITPPPELLLTRRSGDRYRIGAVLNPVPGRDGELDLEVGVGERCPFDYSLGRVIVDIDTLELGKELLAIALTDSELAGRPRLLERALHAIFAQRVGARPLWRLTVRLSLDAGLEST